MKQYVFFPAFVLSFLLIGTGCGSPTASTPLSSDTSETSTPSVVQGDPSACPARTEITEFTTTLSPVEEAGPFDYTTFTSAKATKPAGTNRQIKLFISNKDYSIRELTGPRTPVAGADHGTGIMSLVFYNAEKGNEVGVYDPTAGRQGPYWVTGEMYVPVGETGTSALLGLSNGTGTADIIAITDTEICGTFDMSSKISTLKGTFVATF